VPTEHLLLLVSVIVLAHLGVLAAFVLPRVAARPNDGPEVRRFRPLRPADAGGFEEPAGEGVGLPSMSAIDRVVRLVSLLFLATAGLAVAVSGSFARFGVPIYVLLTAATVAVVMVGVLLPPALLGRGRRVVQASGAIGVVTALVVLTGGMDSPFVAGYFVIVAAAALSSEDVAPAVVSIFASLAYVLVAVVMPSSDGLNAPVVAEIGFRMAALGLLAYLATVIGGQQRRAREAALRLARFDPLTGLYTRHFLYSAIEREISRATRTGRGFCLLMLDLDDLKKVNDTHGHPTGDRIIRAVGEVIRRSVRESDLAARYGGDEFVVVLPETDSSGAFTVASKLRADVAALVLRLDTGTVQTSISAGLVCHPEGGATLEQLMATVDAAMYESKRLGKDRIVGPVAAPDAGNADAGSADAGSADPGTADAGDARETKAGNTNAASKLELGRFGSPV
jgi:diguanylate cyclase (GGDEF)-like protein